MARLPVLSPALNRRNLIAFALALTASSAFAAGKPVRLVAFGDSLTAGYQLPNEAAFPVQLEKALRAKGLDIAIANAGISGDTTTGGLQRLDWSIPEGTDGVILELGANDALRGIDPAHTLANLETMIQRLKARNIRIFLAGMRAPRNNGPDYIAAYDPIFRNLADKYSLPLYPFFLEEVIGMPDLTLPDRMHPNQAGVGRIVSRILPQIEEFAAGLGK